MLDATAALAADVVPASAVRRRLTKTVQSKHCPVYIGHCSTTQLAALTNQSLHCKFRQPAYAIPQNAEQVAQQALKSCERAWHDGVRRQQLELLLPLIGATDIDDWYAQ